MGALRGRRPSAVQVLGVELLIYADNHRRHREQDDALRRALVASGMRASDVFEVPRGEEPDAQPVDPAQDANANLDYSQVTWDEQASPDTWLLLQQQLSQNRVTVTVPDESPAAPIPVAEFDREWT